MTLSSPQREWQEEQKNMVPHFNTFIPVTSHPPTTTPILSRKDSSWTCHRCWLRFMKVVILVAGLRLLYLVLAALLWWCAITDTFVSHMWEKPLEKLMYKLKLKACHIYSVFCWHGYSCTQMILVFIIYPIEFHSDIYSSMCRRTPFSTPSLWKCMYFPCFTILQKFGFHLYFRLMLWWGTTVTLKV